MQQFRSDNRPYKQSQTLSLTLKQNTPTSLFKISPLLFKFDAES